MSNKLTTDERAELEWHRKRAPLVQRVSDTVDYAENYQALGELLDWEAKHPCPTKP
jgi:hypothetical protein